jgi:hypothetical protein
MNSDTFAGTVAEWEDEMALYGVPEHLRCGLARYIVSGIMPGCFLKALLTNDLSCTAKFSTIDTLVAVPRILKFLYWCAPMECHGTPARYHAWIRHRGLTRNNGEAQQS